MAGETDRSPQPDKAQTTWRSWVWLLIVMLFVYFWVGQTAGPDAEPLPYSEFKQTVATEELWR